MAKRKSNVTAVRQDFIEEKFTHNTLRVLPFPPGMYDAINNDVLEEYPMPDVPMVEVKSFAGSDDAPELMADDKNEEYLAEVAAVEATRTRVVAEKILGFVLNECLEVVDVNKMNRDIKRLTKYTSYPDDEQERVIKYVSTYILTQQAHYSRVIKSSLKMTVAGNEEVEARIDSFQD